MHGEGLRLHARWVLPVETAPIEHGWVVVRDSRVADVGRGRFSPVGVDADAVDLGEAVLLPGLINGHVHIGQAGVEPPSSHYRSYEAFLADALRRVMEGIDGNCAAMARAVRDIEACVAVGCFINSVSELEAFRRTRVRGVLFLESTGAHVPRWPKPLACRLGNRLRHEHALSALYVNGLAVVHEYTARMGECGAIRCIHASESPAEVEFVSRGTGPLAPVYRDFHPQSEWSARGMTPLEVLDDCSFLTSGTILVHGNVLTSSDIELARRRNVCVCICPRSSSTIRSPQPPARKLLNAGVEVFLGTDGHLTSPDLDIVREMRYLATVQPDLTPSEIIRMATLNGARALRLGDLGSIARGKRATFTLFRSRDGATVHDPYELVLRPSSSSEARIVDLSGHDRSSRRHRTSGGTPEAPRATSQPS